MRYLILSMAVAVAGSSLAAQSPTGTTGTTAAATATAALNDTEGRPIGEARLQETPNGILLKLELRNATPGVHALHIHETGRCEAPSFTSAGGHFAPAGKQHGFLNDRGHHVGDLPNIEVPASGRLTIEHLIKDATLGAGPRSLLDDDGAALVIHAGKDDYMTAPAGDAGDRIACGRISR